MNAMMAQNDWKFVPCSWSAMIYAKVSYSMVAVVSAVAFEEVGNSQVKL
jgi:hypothetical protein